MTEEEQDKRIRVLGEMAYRLMQDSRSARDALESHFPGLGVAENSTTFLWKDDDMHYRLSLSVVGEDKDDD